MSGRSSNERAGWLAFIVLVLMATVSLIACDESTSEAEPALAEAASAQSMPADEPAAEPQDAAASERSQRATEISQAEAAEGPESVEPEVAGTEPTTVSASPPDDSGEPPPAEGKVEEVEADAETPDAPANGAASSEAREPAQDAAAVEDEQSEAAEGPESVEAEVEETEPTTVSASPPDDSGEQPSADGGAEEVESDAEPPEAPANGAGSSEAPEPAQDAAAAEDEQPQPTELAVVVPDRVGDVTLYAGPAIDWAAVATLEPGAPLTIIGRAPDPSGPKYVWLLAEMPDGAQGWLTADDLALDSDALAFLRELQPSEMEVITSVRDGAWIRVQPDHTSRGCQMSPGGPMAVGGRSPDGEWSLVSLVQRACQDSEGWYYREGWIHGADLEDDPMLSRAPVVYPDGLWLFPVDPQFQPTKLPVCAVDGWGIEAWSFDPEDGSLVFADHCSSDGGGLKRYTPGTAELTSLSSASPYNILVAPVGGRVLMMRGGDWGASGHHKLTILHPDGRTEDIGYLYLNWQNDRARLLQRQARWSPDGQTIIFLDIPRSELTDPDYSDFWLYHVATGERVDLRRGTAAADLWLRDYHFHPNDQYFHPDGQSIYAFASHSYPTGILHRLTLEGDEWPGFTPIESVHWYRISPRGDRIIVSADGKGRIFTDQGELLGERDRGPGSWFPDRDTIAYFTGGQWPDGEWTIEHLPSGRTARIRLPSPPLWSPDGEHFAVVNRANSWTGHSTRDFFDMYQLRMYDVSGELLSVHRFEGCYRHQWPPDGSQFALSVIPFYLCGGP